MLIHSRSIRRKEQTPPSSESSCWKPKEALATAVCVLARSLSRFAFVVDNNIEKPDVHTCPMLLLNKVLVVLCGLAGIVSFPLIQTPLVVSSSPA